MKIKFTKHAKEMLAFRKIKSKQVKETIKNPEIELPGRNEKVIMYRNFGKIYLKVVISKEQGSVLVITNHWIAKKRIKK